MSFRCVGVGFAEVFAVSIFSCASLAAAAAHLKVGSFACFEGCASVEHAGRLSFQALLTQVEESSFALVVVGNGEDADYSESRQCERDDRSYASKSSARA